MPIAKREPPPPGKPKPLLWVFVGAVGLLFIAGMCGTSGNNKTESQKPSANTPTTQSAAPQAWKLMPGDGTHKIGGMDGKNWGIWQATATGDCQWSIRAVRTYTGGEILYEGTATAGELVRVNIQPDGNVSATTGMIDNDHRIVFMTSGCGAWQIAN